MRNDNQKRVAELLQISRKISAQHLPIGHSFIPYDLLLQVYLSELNGDQSPLNIKSLLASLPYSDMGVRYHLRRLIEGDWIEIEKDGEDPRMRNVIAKPKTHKRFDLITDHLTKFLNDQSR